jgi:hypothetical protein
MVRSRGDRRSPIRDAAAPVPATPIVPPMMPVPAGAASLGDQLDRRPDARVRPRVTWPAGEGRSAETAARAIRPASVETIVRISSSVGAAHPRPVAAGLNRLKCKAWLLKPQLLGAAVTGRFHSEAVLRVHLSGAEDGCKIVACRAACPTHSPPIRCASAIQAATTFWPAGAAGHPPRPREAGIGARLQVRHFGRPRPSRRQERAAPPSDQYGSACASDLSPRSSLGK